MLLHVGIAGQYFTPDGDNIYLGFRPEAAIDSSNGVIIVDEDDLDNVTRTGLELAIVRDRLSIQGEYIIADLDMIQMGMIIILKILCAIIIILN